MFDKTLKRRFGNTHKFLTMISISLFSCYEKVFTHMNAWMVKECMRKNMDNITDADYTHAKRVCKDFEIKTLIRWFVCLKWYIIERWYI